MANDALTTVRTRRHNPPRSRSLSGTPAGTKAVTGQVRNAAGGYVFSLPDEARLHRFLTMGTDGGTFYTSERQLTADNAEVVFRAARQAPQTLVRAIKEISLAGRAPRQQPAIFALAVAASHADRAGRDAAFRAVSDVCRTATTLFTFLKYCEQFRGWGRGMRVSTSKWFDGKDADKLAVQMVKYRQREGWTHLDALRMSHTPGLNDAHRILYNWAAGRTTTHRDGRRLRAKLPEVVLAYEALQRVDTREQVIDLAGVDGITWEMIPDRWINDAGVWEALISKGLPIGALIRQLPRITRLGLATGSYGRIITGQLTDVDTLKRGRIHPVNVLVAQKTYAQGQSERGSSTWLPATSIIDALDEAFYASFGAVNPARKSTLVGLDCSGSMRLPRSSASGVPLTCMEATAAVAMVTAATEPQAEFVGFDTRAFPVSGISARRRLDDNVRAVREMNTGQRTDVSMPIMYALANRIYVDSIQILTDGETWRGTVHPFEAMRAYRERVNPDARLSVVAMTATSTSVVPPFDDKAIDVVGFDAAVPQILADFAAGRI